MIHARATAYAAGLLMVFSLFETSVHAHHAVGHTSPPLPRYQHLQNDNGVRGIRVSAFLKATEERVWDVLTDLSQGSRLFESLKAVTPIKGAPGLFNYRMSTSFGDKLMKVQVQRDDARRIIRWRRVSGAFEVFEGSLRVSSSPRHSGYVVLAYTNYVDPGGLGRLVLTKHRLQKNIATMVGTLRRVVEGT